MKLLSSRWTFAMKRIFPVVWFGIVVSVFLIGRSASEAGNPQARWFPFWIVLVLGLVLFFAVLRGLADEVQDHGNYLLVSRGGLQERVELADIIDVGTGRFSGAGGLTLRLRTPGALGDRVVFIPKSPFRLNPFMPHPIAMDLVQRTHRLRLQARA